MSSAIDEGNEKLKQKKKINTEPLNQNDASFKHQRSIAESSSGNQQSDLGYVENVASKYLR